MMKQIYWNIVEKVNDHVFEHRVLLDDGEIFGFENLPRSMLNKIMSSPNAGSLQTVDKSGDIVHYRWEMEK